MKKFLCDIIPYVLLVLLAIFYIGDNNKLQNENMILKAKLEVYEPESYSEKILKVHKAMWEEKYDKLDIREKNYIDRLPSGRKVCCKRDGTIPGKYVSCQHCMCVETTVAVLNTADEGGYSAIAPIEGVDY
jgi:hypothetical protein